MSLFEFLIIYFIVLGIVVPISFGKYEPAYLKVCGKEEKHTIDSSTCNRGIWLKYSLEPGCICIRGVWALSNGFCDEKAVIIVGDGHCFHIGFEIRTAKLIGDPEDPFQSKIYVAPTSLDALYEVSETEFTPALQSDTTLVIGVNPRQVAQRKDYGVCLDLSPDEWDKPVHIYMNPRRSIKEWTLNPKETFVCPLVTPYKYHIGFGEMFMKGRVEPRLLVERHCRDDCPEAMNLNEAQASMGPMGRSLIPNEFNEHDPQSHHMNSVATSDVDTFPPDQPVSTFTKKYAHKRPTKTKEEQDFEKEQARAGAEEVEDHFTKETNEQTLRMMHAHISPLLLNISSPQILTPSYKYFQLSRQVVEKACPEEFVPKLVLRGLMRMFRQLLWETQETFTHSESGDEGHYERTMAVMEHCLNFTREPAFQYVTLNESYSNDPDLHETELLIKNWPNESFLPPERCPNPVIFAINGTMYNLTHYEEDWSVFIRNISMFGVHIKFNDTLVDFVIETAWKIAVMGTYRCSKYFNGSSFTDYYTMSSHMQSFFNPKILKRWYYKPSVDATLEILKMLFPAYNLKKFAFGLDMCLLGMHRFGAEFYSSRIFTRPKLPMTPEDIVQSTKYYNMQKEDTIPVVRAHHLSMFDYAPKPDWPDIVFPRPGEDKLPVPPAGRRKRGVLNSSAHIGFDLWGNKARCIRTYMEPLTKPQAFGYSIPHGCVTPVGINGFSTT